jgi:hypothetical protein
MAKLEKTDYSKEPEKASKRARGTERHALASRHADGEGGKGDAGLDRLKYQSQKVFDDLRALDTYAKEHARFRGFSREVTRLRTDHQALADMLRDPTTVKEIATDPAAKTTVSDELRRIQTRTDEIREAIEKERLKVKAGERPVPAYVKENRVPLDGETFLGNKELASQLGLNLERTDLRMKGATVYQDQHSNYYHRDTLHRGAGAEIECYDRTGKHTGTRGPDGSEKDGPVEGRTLW